MCSSNGPANCVREEQGGPHRDGPRSAFPGSPWECRADAGKARAYREMHELDAVTAASTRRRIRSDLRVPVPAEDELPLPTNLRSVFPSRTPIGRVSVVEGHSRLHGASRPTVCGSRLSQVRNAAAPV